MTTKMGAQGLLRILLAGGTDVRDVLLARSAGGQKLESGLAERVASGHATKVEHVISERMTMASFAETAGELLMGQDIAVFSLDPDAVGSESLDFLAAAEAVAEKANEVNCHVFFLNASTIDPTRVVSNYHGIPEPFTRKAQRLDLALLKLSISHGISIIDADRILGEMGAKEHVVGPVDYSAEACEALCDETIRIITDYGFFEARPVMAQLGSRRDDIS
jgi:hypothetical protein